MTVNTGIDTLILSNEGVGNEPITVQPIDKKLAAKTVIAHHYLHRRPPMSHAHGVYKGFKLVGVVTYGSPASRHLQMGACPSDPGLVLELNRLWLDDSLPRNTASWVLSRSLKLLPPRIVVSYADTKQGHLGYVYRAANFHYHGWTDMERKTPRYDYIPADPTKHTRDSFRTGGAVRKVRRLPKVKYWITTGNKSERKQLERLCGWRRNDWKMLPPPDLPDEIAV